MGLRRNRGNDTTPAPADGLTPCPLCGEAVPVGEDGRCDLGHRVHAPRGLGASEAATVTDLDELAADLTRDLSPDVIEDVSDELAEDFAEALSSEPQPDDDRLTELDDEEDDSTTGLGSELDW